MAVTPSTIAVALGVAVPEPSSALSEQWTMWIEDASMLIEARRLEVDATLVLDQAKLDYVVRQAVVAHARQPDNATQVSVAVDDANVSRTYRSSAGMVQILDEWWALLGLAPRSSGAFSFAPSRAGSIHAPYCSLYFRGLACSCGANLTNYQYPLYEGGPLEP